MHVCVCVCVCVCLCVCVWVSVYIFLYMYMYMSMYIYVCIYIHIYTNTCVYTPGNAYANNKVGLIHTYTHTYIYTHIHTHTYIYTGICRILCIFLSFLSTHHTLARTSLPPAAAGLFWHTTHSRVPQIRPLLPSYGGDYTVSVPFTRIRDIAHRSDIPKHLKDDIKHNLQNKLHRWPKPKTLNPNTNCKTSSTGDLNPKP